MFNHLYPARLDSPLEVYFFGDRQQGSPAYDESGGREAWAEFKYQFKRSKNKLAIGLGDYGDFLRPTMRERLVSATVTDASARQQLDDTVRRNHDQILREMDFLQGHLIGLHEGHHNWQFASGENTDQRLAAALKTTYLGWVATTRLQLAHPSQRSGCGYVYTIVSTHGDANGGTFAAATRWMEGRLVDAFQADQYAMGHGCKNGNWVPKERKVVRRVGPPGVDVQLPRCLIVGGFARAYTDGWKSDYVERRGLVPQAVGWGIVRLQLTRHRFDTASRGVGKDSRTLKVEQVNVTPTIGTAPQEQPQAL